MVCKLKLSRDGTISIPGQALQQLGWRDGDELTLHVHGDTAVLDPQPKGADSPEVRPGSAEVATDEAQMPFSEWLEKYAGSADAGYSTDEIMDMTRGED